MASVVFPHRHDAIRRLAELGVSLEAIQRALLAGQSARGLCSPNDPPFIPGTEAWRFVVRTLRDELLPLGWLKSDRGNYSLVFHEARQINIVVATGDNQTRRWPGTPKTRSLKGLYTEAAVARNLNQYELFPETIADELKEIAAILRFPVWVLLINITEEEIRAEFSLPTAIDGAIVDWSERIFIPDFEGPDSGAMTDDDFGTDFDVPVHRKA
jgi:hypothetical protein